MIDATGLADALARQSGRHPVASELFGLGYASERQLCTAHAAQTGWPAIILDESAIQLDVLQHVSIECARIFNALVVYEAELTLVVAAARPEDAIVPSRELGAALGKTVELTGDWRVNTITTTDERDPIAPLHAREHAAARLALGRGGRRVRGHGRAPAAVLFMRKLVADMPKSDGLS